MKVKNINKNVKDINTHSVTIFLYYKGKKTKVTEKRKRILQSAMQEYLKNDKDNFGSYYTCEIGTWKDDTAAFARAKKPKKFTPQQAQEIKDEPISIRQKSQKYDASTRTIQKIMNDKYY